MSAQNSINYARIAEAINYLQQNFTRQPNLDDVAEKINLSPAHFQRLFTEWAGTSPKKFLQYISVQHAKKLLAQNDANVFNTAYDTGFSSTSRLHELFINIEGMTPAEYKNGGRKLHINYSFAYSPFGMLVVAATPKGICYMAFTDGEDAGRNELQAKFPYALLTHAHDEIQERAVQIFNNDGSSPAQIKLHLKGTPFQLKVWEALLKIPMGRLATYGSVAAETGNVNASRAVGSAIGSNPVAFLIPCHRVIQSTGLFGGYMWGPARKTAIIGWEGAKTEMGG